jgi:tetratricopeptide (TPR) repeat protein
VFDVREYWDFSDPKGSRERFLEILPGQSDIAVQQEIIAQIARSYGLEKNFDQGFATLDKVVPCGRAVACFNLERGRLYRSSGDVASAKPYFQKAVETTEEDLKVDALHMLAIISEPEEADRLNLEALGIASRSTNLFAQRWQGSLLNNLGWTYFETGRLPEALNTFKRAVKIRDQEGKKENIYIAYWSVARCYRELKMHDEALTILNRFVESEVDEYLYEELAENYKAIGQDKDAELFQSKLDSLRPKLQS